VDPKVVIVCQKLGLDASRSVPYRALAQQANFDRLVVLLQSYACSTAEDYIWHIHRALTQAKEFPPTMLKKYTNLLTHYKSLYCTKL
jgi:hypothetical protein